MCLLANLPMIELNANVKYGGGTACFKVHKEGPGVYCAQLIYFDGEVTSAPPQEINLVRGIRQWTGSCNDVNLLNALGKIIEETYTDSSKAFTSE